MIQMKLKQEYRLAASAELEASGFGVEFLLSERSAELKRALIDIDLNGPHAGAESDGFGQAPPGTDRMQHLADYIVWRASQFPPLAKVCGVPVPLPKWAFREALDSKLAEPLAFSGWVEDIDSLISIVMRNPHALEDIEPRIKSRAVRMAAVSMNGTAIQFVPDAEMDDELCRAAFESTINSFPYIASVYCPDEYIDTIFARGNIYLFASIPESRLTPDICLRAVNENGYTIKHMPAKLLTEEICKAAIVNTARAIQDIYHVPELLGMIPELRRFAIEADGTCIAVLDPESLTKRECLAALKSNYLAIEYIPDHLRTDAILVAALRKCEHATDHMTDEEITRGKELLARTERSKFMNRVRRANKIDEVSP